MAQFGTMTKPLHAGLAAKSGVMAASLARAGVDAGLATLDGPTGMNRLMVGPDYEQLRDSAHPCRARPDPSLRDGGGRRAAAAAVERPQAQALPQLRQRAPGDGRLCRAYGRTRLRAGDIEAVHVRAPVTHLNNLMYTDPADALQAKFSLEYGLACIALTGNCTLADFTDAAARARGAARFLPPHPPPSGRQGRGRVPDRGRDRA